VAVLGFRCRPRVVRVKITGGALGVGRGGA
jgi:hypothetical protein